MSSNQTHVFYRNYDGEACLFERTARGFRVSNWDEEHYGSIAYESPRWVVRAETPLEAEGMIRHSLTTALLGSNLGVWHDAERHEGPPPFDSDREEFWHVVVTCDTDFPYAIGVPSRESGEQLLENLKCRHPGECWTDPERWDGDDDCWNTFHKLDRFTVS